MAIYKIMIDRLKKICNNDNCRVHAAIANLEDAQDAASVRVAKACLSRAWSLLKMSDVEIPVIIFKGILKEKERLDTMLAKNPFVRKAKDD